MDNGAQSKSNSPVGPHSAVNDNDGTRTQELLAVLRLHIPFKFYDALTENISVIQTLLAQEQENISTELSINIISNVTSLLETFTEIFYYNPPPLTTQGQNFSFAHVEEKPIKKFRETFRKQLRGVTFLANGIRNKTLLSAISESLKCLDKMCSLGRVNDEDKAKFVKSLQKRMDMEGHWIEMINTYRKFKVTEAIKSELYENFQETLRIEYPELFYNDTAEAISSKDVLIECKHYDENELFSFINNLSSTIVSDFKEQISFEDDSDILSKLVQGIEERLRHDRDKLVAKNLANKNRHKEKEIEEKITQSLQSYESKMSPVVNSHPGTNVTIISIEKHHNSVRSAVFQEFQEKITSPDQTNLLHHRIFERLRELVSTANVNAGNEMEFCRKTCEEEVSSCFKNLESHLGKLSSESPKFVGILRSKVETWLEETLREVARGTVASKENVEALLKRVQPSDCNSFSESMLQKETDRKKLEYIKGMVFEASKTFIEMTEASRRKSDSSETRASFNRGRVKSQLEFEIKSTFGDHEPTESHIKDLEGLMNQYIMSKMVKAMENLDKKLDHFPVRSTSSSSSKSVKQDHQEVKPKMEIKMEENSYCEKEEEDLDYESCEGNENEMEDLEEGEYLSYLEKYRCQTASTTKVDLRISSPVTLVFQFSVNMLQMAVMNAASSTPYMLKNEFGDLYTPTNVGLTKNGSLVYGRDLDHHISNNTGIQTYAIEQQFIYGMNFPWSKSTKINGKIQNVKVELLLAYLLKRLKASAEKRLSCGECLRAVIAVPYWMASTQRIQMKDAARIAGFSEVHLVNDLPAAIHAFITKLQEGSVVCQIFKILVLSENADYIDCAVYTVDRAYLTELKMMSHYGCSLIESRVKADLFSVTNDVMNMCSDALTRAKSAQSQLAVQSVLPDAVLVVCSKGDNHAFWRQVLENVRKEYTGNSHCTVINESEAVITGAVLLAQNLETYGKNVKNKVGCKFWKTRTETNTLKTGLKVTDAVALNVEDIILPAFCKMSKTFECTLPKNVTGTTLCQSGVVMLPRSDNDRFTKIPVGCLKVFETYPNPASGIYKQIIPYFNINHEGIVSLDHVLILTRRRNVQNSSKNDPEKPKRTRGKKRKRSMEVASPTGGNENINPNTPVEYLRLMENDLRISWMTPNLNKKEFENYKKLLVELDNKCT